MTFKEHWHKSPITNSAIIIMAVVGIGASIVGELVYGMGCMIQVSVWIGFQSLEEKIDKLSK